MSLLIVRKEQIKNLQMSVLGRKRNKRKKNGQVSWTSCTPVIVLLLPADVKEDVKVQRRTVSGRRK